MIHLLKTKKLFFFTLSEIRQWLLPAVVISIVIILISFLLLLLLSPIFRNPPVKLIRQDPEALGMFCPGQFIPFHNKVTVKPEEVIYYYISVTEGNGLENVPESVYALPGFPHPFGGTFNQVIPWYVPQLKPGAYYRVMAARGSDGRQKPSTVYSSFIVKTVESCANDTEWQKDNPGAFQVDPRSRLPEYYDNSGWIFFESTYRVEEYFPRLLEALQRK